jgi:hypothetical protein
MPATTVAALRTAGEATPRREIRRIASVVDLIPGRA